MKVLLLSEFYPPVRGGLEFHVESLAAGLHCGGDEVHVATLSDTTETVGPVPVHQLHNIMSRVPGAHESRARPFHPPCSDPMVRRQLRRMLQELQPDVVHAHNWIAASVPPRSAAAVVYTAHDFGLVCSRRDLYYLDERLCSGPATARCLRCATEHYGSWRGPALAALTPFGRGRLRPDAVMAVSQRVAEQIKPFVSVEPRVVPNFVPDDVAAVQNPPPGLPSTPFVMYAGATNPAKGLDTLLESWDEGRGFAAPMVWAVLGTSITSPSAPRSLTILQLDRGQVQGAWSRAALAVVPSRWHEPCPTAAIEAMAAGIPVVASAIGGITELITDGVDGLLVPPGDAVALRRAIQQLLASTDLRARLGEAARHRALQYTSATVLPRIREVYNEAIEHRRDVSVRKGRR